MNKPSVFISSTIYDFKDLRSAIKYWLEEAGYEVQSSEHSDFAKDSSLNSYDACLDVIPRCDYFILLIGRRVGGMFDKEISITRKEYQTAYELAKAGVIKRVIVFVRQDVWNVLQDRQSLQKLISELDIQKNGETYDKDKVVYHESKFVHDAKHIQSFIDEVTRKAEFKNNENPCFNWVNLFSGFSEIIDVLRVEMRLENNVSRQIAEQSIKMALAHNIREFTRKTSTGSVVADFLGFKSMRPKIAEALADARSKRLDSSALMTEIINLTTSDIQGIPAFLLTYSESSEKIESFSFEQAISSGVFLGYDKEKMRYESNNIVRALSDMIGEIRKLKKFVANFPKDAHARMIETLYGFAKKVECIYSFQLMDLAQLNSIYERQHNIYMLTQYLMRYILHHDNISDYPTLMNGFVESERPSEADINSIFEE